MARSLPPTVRLDGFDVSLDQCPPASWLPHNVKLHTWDIFTDPPQKFIGAFDVVHVRLITLVIKDNDPRQVISSLSKLLSRPSCPSYLDEYYMADFRNKNLVGTFNGMK